MLIRMPNQLTQQDLSRLSAEAAQNRSHADEEDREIEREFNFDHFIARCRNLSATGKALKEIHHGDTLVRAVSQVAGCSLAPTLTNYLYYRKGDFIGLHRDQRVCHSVLLVWLRGPGGPLHIHPDLLGADLGELFSLSRRWNGHPPYSQPYFLQDGPLLMTGSQHPHHRPPHEDDEDLIIAAFCFEKRGNTP
jgi:hypothetical protein